MAIKLPEIPGYLLTEVLYVGARTLVYRGQQQVDQQPVILKLPNAESPTLEDLSCLQHEYNIAQRVNSPYLIEILDLIATDSYCALICEDFGGQSLKKYAKRHTLSLTTFLDIAIQLSEALAALHCQQIIHKDIKPANILLNPQTGQVKLTDFSIATQLNQEVSQLTHPSQIEGTLAYMSPEQTGRMNRLLDYRSDFYSLGVTFYELLTGQLPFQSDDSLELVHSHIAKTFIPVQQLNPSVPNSLAAIIHKLMAKSAEDRYQSTAGLLTDLKRCLEDYSLTGTIATFVPGHLDYLGQLNIPQKLYGREQQVKALLQAFERVNQGWCELVVVTGHSGIGKSSLIHELYKSITQHKGYFISGKFDQFQRNVPYACLLQAYRSLMRQILTESEAQIQRWRQRLLKALGTNGQIMIDAIPELSLIIGPQPPVPEVGSLEAQNRFHRVFQQFATALAEKEAPLVLFLDDQQWTDLDSLAGLRAFLNNPENCYQLIIAAYRDNEVDSLHPLAQTLEQIEADGHAFETITLAPLGIADVIQLVADALHSPATVIIPLAQLLHTKTQGNPFFLTQLLKLLHQDGLLTFDYGKGCWQWDLAQIQQHGITDDVVELMIGKLRKLPASTQQLLSLSACIGNQFNLETLAIVSEQSLGQAAQNLWVVLQEGLILPLDNTYRLPHTLKAANFQRSVPQLRQIRYKFLHDRVQQAAYALIPADQKQLTHLKVGQLLLKNASVEEVETNLFEIVNQLNLGSALIEQVAERVELARLNLAAGRKAKVATAYDAALSYLSQGINLLTVASWQEDYELTLSLYTETAEVAYLNTSYERSEQSVETIERYANNNLDKVKAYELRIQLYMAQLKMWEAIITAVEALSMLGITVACPIDWHHGDYRLPELDKLDDIPLMSDPVKLSALKILTTVSTTAYQTRPEIFRWVVLTQLELCLQYGHSTLAVFAYIAYAWLCSTTGESDRAYQSGRIAMRLLEQFNTKDLECSVIQLFECFVRHHKEHIRATFVPLKRSIQVGLETGDIEYVGYSAMNYVNHIFFSGETLESLNQTQLQYIDLLLKLKQEFQIYYTQLWRQVTLNLQGKAADPCCLLGESFDETVMLPRLQATQNHQSLFAFYSSKLLLNYLFQNYAAAVKNAELAAQYAGSGAGLVASAIYCFYYCLALLACYEQAEQAQPQDLDTILHNQALMQNWAQSAPMNYQHKYDLVEAERCRLLQQTYQALEYYDRAIQGACENGYIQEAALASERAAEYYFYLNKPKVAQVYLQEAYSGYQQWGALAKVRQMSARYPDLLHDPLLLSGATTQEQELVGGERTFTRSSTSAGEVLDLATVMKAAQVISGEIVLDSLLKKLLHIILENTSAQKGCLILDHDGCLLVEVISIYEPEILVSLQSVPVEASPDIPQSLIYYVARTHQSLVLNDATEEEICHSDPYILKHQPKSIICAPILYQGQFIGLVYLENNLVTGAFTNERLKVLNLLCSQAAISLENARLYQRTQNYAQQTQEYSHQLERSLQEQQQMQLQLIQSEKMSALGNLVAGVAHEINNPVGFLSGNIQPALDYVSDLFDLIDAYQTQLPDPGPEITAKIEWIDLDYLREDLPKLIGSMREGVNRICSISNSLRVFSRADQDEKVPFDIHAGLDSTILILKHRLRATEKRPAIQIIKNYGNLPAVECFPGQLNQVFMNLLANAIDALEELNQDRALGQNRTAPHKIEIYTGQEADQAVIKVQDNGIGMSEAVMQKIFQHLFTTKPIGKGTGLGLSIARQIIVDKHQGSLEVDSMPGEGTEFVIRLPIQS